MQSIADILIHNHGESAPKSFFDELQRVKDMSVKELTQRRVDRYNQSEGKLHEQDGYNCRLCRNRGDTAVLVDRGGMFYESYPPCRCMEIRRSISRMNKSGLAASIREYTFERFVTDTPWRQGMLDKAKGYLQEGVHQGCWFFIGGQPGCGKTHICTAIARHLLYERSMLYMAWEQDSKRLKALITDAGEYAREIDRLKTVDVLYIDDLFKPVKDENGTRKPPTPADVKLAFEIINYRYINKLPTIISSEWYMNDLIDLDEATGSRIAERCGPYQIVIGMDKGKNFRVV